MTTTLDLQKSGGGAPSYISGSEVFRDLSSASFDAGSSLADIGKTVILYSSTDGKSYKLPNSNASGMAVGKGTGFRVLPRSKPIKILNQGTAGTNAILEGFALPGADFAFFAADVSSVQGDWHGRGYGLFPGPVPVTLPGARDAGVDFGSVILVASHVNGGTDNIIPNANLSRANGSTTLFSCVAIPNAGTSIVQYAMTYNHATDAWTWGSPVTAMSSANQWVGPRIIGISSTAFAIVAYELTAATAKARGSTVSGTTITQGTAITSGAWSVNPSNGSSALQSSLIVDSTSSFFWASSYDASHLGITHFSLSGANLTQDGGGTFGSSVAPAVVNYGGYSPSANIIELSTPTDNASFGVSRYTYSAGSVTNTWMRRFNVFLNGSGYLANVDATNRVYYLSGPTSGNAMRTALNAGLTDVTETQIVGFPVPTDSAAPAAVAWGVGALALSDNEAILLGSPSNRQYSLTLFDPTISIRTRSQVAAGTSSDSGGFNHIVAATNGWLQTATNILGADINLTNRRMAILYTYQSQSVAAGRLLAMQMLDLPRNYDQATC